MIMNERGGASLIIVTLTTVLIAVLTVATTKLMTGELRQANDSESGIKAYYLAEGASEESIAAIKYAVTNGADLEKFNQNCDMDGTPSLFAGSPPYGALPDGISCRKIRSSTDFLTDQVIQVGGVNHFDLSRNYFDRVELAWDKEDIPTEPEQRDFTTGATPADRDVERVPAYLEVTRIVYEDSDPGAATSIDPASISVKSLILSPVKGQAPGAWQPQINPNQCGTVSNPTINFDQCQANQGGSVKVLCDKTAGKRCATTLTSFIPDTATGNPQKRVVMRIRPYYNNVIYDMGLYQGTNRVTFKLDAINLDITSYVGGSYRRILDSFDVTANPGPIDALWGDEEVCKSFLIKSESPTGEAPNDEVQNRYGCEQAF